MEIPLNASDPDPIDKVRTGITGLDAILAGGVPRDEIHLVQGAAGTGKTTIGLQFLLEGAAAGETVLFITFAQTEAALRKIAASHGWSLDGVKIEELMGADASKDRAEQTLFRTADVELGETTESIFAAVDRIQPERVVLDSVASLRLLAGDALRYRRQLLTMRRFFAGRSGTVLLVDGPEPDLALEELAHGVVQLERLAPEYGDVRRRLLILKMRGMAFNGGYHNFRIRRGGLEVYPRIQPQKEDEYTGWETMTSGVAGLDKLLGGGLEQGAACLIVGSTGTGKTSVSTLFAYEAAKRGLRVALFCFDERPQTLLMRSEGLGMNLRPLVAQGLITIKPISTAELSPGEFSQLVREAVEDQAKVVIMDSLTGYFHSMPQEEALLSQMHDLLTYLSNNGVLSMLIVSQHGLIGQEIQGPLDVSYMADAVVLLRHFEAGGAVRKAISVLKKRHGPHESTIRELKFAPGGISVGEPIKDFSGVLSGMPVFQGQVGR
jgi:circadian clock protein KaiC